MLSPYIRAAFPAVAVATVEEDRFCAQLLRELPDHRVLAISASGGLRDLRSGLTTDPAATFVQAFAHAATHPGTLLIVRDWQHVARNAVAYRTLKDHFPDLKANGSCVIALAPRWSLPAELEHDMPVLEMPLPSRDQLRSALHLVADSAEEAISAEVEKDCLDAAAGLTLQEAENSFALALVESGHLDAARVEVEKMRLVKNSGFLEVWRTVDPASVGGLEELKSYIASEVLPCRDDVDLRVRGVLLIGVPGVGKSLAAKAVGAMMGYPVLRMDVDALKGSLVGQSESNMRAALKLADAVAPCVLFIDEIEKAIGGYQSSAQTDSGVTLGMVGSLLVWMQEHDSPVITVATANNYSMLPAELTRAGRFDERFFVDLPSLAERVQIAAIHLQRFGCFMDGFTDGIAAMTDGWTGAEIEQLTKSAARRSNRQPTLDLLTSCAADIKPLSVVRAEEIQALRSWARGTLRLANAPDAASESSGCVPNHGSPNRASSARATGRSVQRVDGERFKGDVSLN